MSRTEIRDAKHGKETAAGSVEQDMKEIKKLQENKAVNGILTITARCNEVFTVICC